MSTYLTRRAIVAGMPLALLAAHPVFLALAWAQTRARKAGCAVSSASGIPARIARRVRSVDMGDNLPS